MIGHPSLLPACAFSQEVLPQRKRIHEGHATFRAKHTFCGVVTLQGSIYLYF